MSDPRHEKNGVNMVNVYIGELVKSVYLIFISEDSNLNNNQNGGLVVVH